MATATVKAKEPVFGYMPQDTPPVGSMLSLGFQQVLTLFPATVLVAILTKFDVGVTLLATGLGTIIALLVSKRRIPMYYGSSFSYITVVITVMSLYVPECFNDPNAFYCPEGVGLVQVGIIIATSADAPADIQTFIVEVPQDDGPWGARGVGEHPMVPTIPAIANAIYNAVGVRLGSSPFTAEKVYLALVEAGIVAG